MNLKKLYEAIRIIRKIPGSKMNFSYSCVRQDKRGRPCGCAGAWLAKKWKVDSGWGTDDIARVSFEKLGCNAKQENDLFYEFGYKNEGTFREEPITTGAGYKSWWLSRAMKIARQVKAHRARARKQTKARRAARAR